MRNHFGDPFLHGLDTHILSEIEARRTSWGLAPAEFYARFETWFANFDERDKPLALKIFQHLQYFSEERFELRIRDLWMPVSRFLHVTGGSVADLLLVIPDDRGDSADRHA